MLIYLFCAPVHSAWIHGNAPFGLWDGLLTAAFLFLLAGETIADEQMWRFQQRKIRLVEGGERVMEGFFQHGLYRYSRHPNYFCEILIWWVFYGFAVSASGEWLHWTIIGTVMLSLLFDSSVRFGESISKGKYPAYADYQKRVSRLIHWPPRRSP